MNSRWPKVARIQETLDALRQLVDMSTVRVVSGRRVADAVPPFGREWSPMRKVSDLTGMAPGTVSACVAILAKAGYVQRGTPGPGHRRWVALDGDFKH